MALNIIDIIDEHVVHIRDLLSLRPIMFRSSRRSASDLTGIMFLWMRSPFAGRLLRNFARLSRLSTLAARIPSANINSRNNCKQDSLKGCFHSLYWTSSSLSLCLSLCLLSVCVSLSICLALYLSVSFSHTLS